MTYKRHFPDWLTAFQNYASFGEAPRRMYFFVGLSTLAGALRRHVWIDQYYFKWYVNLYTILVAPPGVVAKTTTADIGMDILRRVPGVQFGPSVASWQALVKGFGEASESFLHEPSGEYLTHSPMTISSGEFGNLLNPQDKEMVDMLVNLWDGKGFRKITKHSGTDDVVNPWINIIACTTPAWIAGNFPEYMIGGGFTSRCVFVYADAKERFVAYPGLSVSPDIALVADKLVEDLTHIATKLVGEYVLQPDALAWGKEWYEEHNTHKPQHLQDDRFGGYLARKQTFIHKIAMLMAASCRDELIITKGDLETASIMITDLEAEMINVFKKIGRSDLSLAGDRLIAFIKARGRVEYGTAYRYIHAQFPAFRDFEDALKGLIQAGYLTMFMTGGKPMLHYNALDDGEVELPVAGE